MRSQNSLKNERICFSRIFYWVYSGVRGYQSWSSRHTRVTVHPGITRLKYNSCETQRWKIFVPRNITMPNKEWVFIVPSRNHIFLQASAQTRCDDRKASPLPRSHSQLTPAIYSQAAGFQRSAHRRQWCSCIRLSARHRSPCAPTQIPSRTCAHRKPCSPWRGEGTRGVDEERGMIRKGFLWCRHVRDFVERGVGTRVGGGGGGG